MQKKFQKWLFIFISIAFLVTLTLSYFIQTRTAYKNAELIISLKIEDIKKEILTNQENLKTIRHESDSEAINKAKTLAWLLYSRPEIEKEQDTLVELLKILNVDEIDITNEKGIIVNSTTPIHLGFDMNSTSQSQWFMQLLENPDLELVQDPLPRGSDGKIMQFAGVALLNKPGFVQISYSSERLQKAMDLANIENIAHGFRIGKNGTAILVKQDKIVSIENPKWLNKNIKDLGINPSFLSSDSKRFLANISNTNYTCIHSTLGDYNIIGILPENEMFLNRNSNIVQVLLFNIVLFGVVFLLISILVQKIVINGIYKVNRSLRKITDGNLNIEIKVDSTQEFRNLSQGINSMVSSLKNAIEQANTRIDSELEFAQSIQLSSLPQNTNSYSASAYNEFDLYALMKTAKKVGLRTESSSRFEKGLSPEIALRAINRAVELAEMIGAGKAVEAKIDVYPEKEKQKIIKFEPEKINNLLGMNISEEEMKTILENLGIKVNGNMLEIPYFRVDIERTADIAEEIIRIHGYDTLQSTLINAESTLGAKTKEQKLQDKIKELLVTKGFSEMYSFAFISPEEFEKCKLDSTKAIKIKNPLYKKKKKKKGAQRYQRVTY